MLSEAAGIFTIVLFETSRSPIEVILIMLGVNLKTSNACKNFLWIHSDKTQLYFFILKKKKKKNSVCMFSAPSVALKYVSLFMYLTTKSDV